LSYSVLFSVIIAATTIQTVGPTMVTLGNASTAATELFTLIDRHTEINPFEDKGKRLSDFKGAIQLKHVDFTYPTRPDASVLQDFSVEAPAGKVTALVVSYIIAQDDPFLF
jgi:ATP-binding cassette, subfamily B (MDR/TAP), member 1